MSSHLTAQTEPDLERDRRMTSAGKTHLQHPSPLLRPRFQSEAPFGQVPFLLGLSFPIYKVQACIHVPARGVLGSTRGPLQLPNASLVAVRDTHVHSGCAFKQGVVHAVSRGQARAHRLPLSGTVTQAVPPAHHSVPTSCVSYTHLWNPQDRHRRSASLTLCSDKRNLSLRKV